MARGGAPVQLTDIVDALWGERPPGRAVNMKHRHVRELRRLLEPALAPHAEGALLLRGGGGYRLVVAADSVDLPVFRQLVLRARDLLREQKSSGLGTAVDTFVEALSLRGLPTVGDPASGSSHPVFAELEREYDAVVREAAEVALRGEGRIHLPRCLGAPHEAGVQNEPRAGQRCRSRRVSTSRAGVTPVGLQHREMNAQVKQMPAGVPAAP